ncbi:50S ribosomal protein L5 [uncultured Muribaculum sp.]|nr:50S ribosomal protein L5 [uncultured Muribaculum sp.]
MANATLHKDYKERIVPALEKEFNYTTVMQVPRLEKIVINQGLGEATQDKKIIETAINELTAITGQKAVATLSRKDISNFKVRKKNPIGARVTLRRDKMYEFLERLVRVALPRIRDFKGIESKLDGRGNYTLGITEQIIFPEINIDSISKLQGMNITFVTSAKTDEEGYALLKEYAQKRAELKKIVNTGNPEDAFEAAQKLQALPKNASTVRLHNRCSITGRPKGYMRQFGISRIQFREMASAGLIPGVKKASW